MMGVDGALVDHDGDHQQQQHEGVKLQHAVAMYDYVASAGQGQVALTKGEVVSVIHARPDGWCVVLKSNGDKGDCPTSYLCTAALSQAKTLPAFVDTTSLMFIERIFKKKRKYGIYCLQKNPSARPESVNLVIWARGQHLQTVPIVSHQDGFGIVGDSIHRPSLRELLLYYTAHEMKSGWGKLTTNPLTLKEVEDMRKRDARNAKLTKTLPHKPNAQPATPTDPSNEPSQRSQTDTGDTSIVDPATIDPEELKVLLKHIRHSLDMGKTFSKATPLNEIQKSQFTELVKIRKRLTSGKPISTKALDFVRTFDPKLVCRKSVTGETRRASISADGKGASTPSPAPYRSAPPPPLRRSSVVSPQRTLPPTPHKTTESQPPKSLSASEQPHKKPASPQEQPVDVDMESILSNLKSSVVQQIRDDGDIPYSKARSALLTVLDVCWSAFGSSKEFGAFVDAISESNSPIVGGKDEAELKGFFESLTEIKNDSQERSWSATFDTEDILDLLGGIRAIVRDGNPAVVAPIVCEWKSTGSFTSFEIIETITEIYQSETRAQVRRACVLLLLELVCLDPAVSEELKISVLPPELAQSIVTKCSSVDITTLSDDAAAAVVQELELFAVVYATGEGISSLHREYLFGTFLPVLFSLTSSVNDKIMAGAVAAILALNMHLPQDASTDQPCLNAASAADCRHMSEQLFHYFNRYQDPVRALRSCSQGKSGSRTSGESGFGRTVADAEGSFEEMVPETHSVMRFLLLVYSHPMAASWFSYDADLAILVEMILRELQDRPLSEKATESVLQLLCNIVTNTSYRIRDQCPPLVELLEFISQDEASPAVVRQHARDALADSEARLTEAFS